MFQFVFLFSHAFFLFVVHTNESLRKKKKGREHQPELGEVLSFFSFPAAELRVLLSRPCIPLAESSRSFLPGPTTVLGLKAAASVLFVLELISLNVGFFS
jgi:hypothetical protein